MHRLFHVFTARKSMMDSMTTTTAAMMLEFAQDGADVVECDEDIVNKINEVSYKVDIGAALESS